MKTQDTKLRLAKRDVIELNSEALKDIKGGWTTTVSNITTIINFSKDTLCTSDVK